MRYVKTSALIPMKFLSTMLFVGIGSFLITLLFASGLTTLAAFKLALICGTAAGAATGLISVVVNWKIEREGKLHPPLMTTVTACAIGLTALMAVLGGLACSAVSDNDITNPRRFWAAIISLVLVVVVAEFRIRDIRRNEM